MVASALLIGAGLGLVKDIFSEDARRRQAEAAAMRLPLSVFTGSNIPQAGPSTFGDSTLQGAGVGLQFGMKQDQTAADEVFRNKILALQGGGQQLSGPTSFGPQNAGGFAPGFGGQQLSGPSPFHPPQIQQQQPSFASPVSQTAASRVAQNAAPISQSPLFSQFPQPLFGGGGGGGFRSDTQPQFIL